MGDLENVARMTIRQLHNGLKREGKELAVSVGRGLIVTGILWGTQRVADKVLQRKSIGKSFDVTKELRTKAVNHITDRIIEVTVGQKKDARDERTLEPEYQSITEYLLSEQTIQAYHRVRETAYSFPAQHTAMMQVMFHRFWHEKCTYDKVLNWTNGDKCAPPTIKRIHVGNDETYAAWEETNIYGVYEDIPIVMRLEKWTLGGNIVILSTSDSHARTVLDAYRTFLQQENYLKGRVVDSDGLLMDISTCPEWDDILLPAKLKEQLQYHTVNFINKIDVLRAKGLRTYRGNLWRGIPGVGKTMAAKIVAKECNGLATFLAANGGQLRETEDLAATFAMARWLAPTILLLDDIDRLSEHLQEMLLGELDGIRNNDGLVVIATANDITLLSEALANRPNRFDLIIDFPAPSIVIRQELLCRLLLEIPMLQGDQVKLEQFITNEQLSELVELTDGLSAVHCEEIIRRARIEAVCQGDDNEEKLTSETILTIAKQVADTYRSVSDEFRYKDEPIKSRDMPATVEACGSSPHQRNTEALYES